MTEESGLFQPLAAGPSKIADLSHHESRLLARRSIAQHRPVRKPGLRGLIGFHLASLRVRLCILAIILWDFGLLLYDIGYNENRVTYVMTWVIVSLYMLELALRLFAEQRQFFYRWINWLDMLVILASFISQCIGYDSVSNSLSVVRFVRFIKLIRFLRVVLMSVREWPRLRKAMRRQISQNKRRLVRAEHELDMTYITERMIATSLPSSWLESLYRNNIRDVARYLDSHYPDHYRLFNLCAEREYDHAKFQYAVTRYLIEDHNVASLALLLQFSKDVQQYLTSDVENVAVVHCRGGKGRTGMCIAAWMLHANLFQSSEEALAYFAHRRTDTSLSSKFQGVETPSQYRFVGYYAKIIANGFELPPPRSVAISSIRIVDLPIESANDIQCEIKCAGTILLSRETVLTRKRDLNTIELTGPALGNLKLVNEIKFRFFTTSQTLRPRKAYDKCLFFFWLHSAFVPISSDIRMPLLLNREELDNGHFKKNHKSTIFPDTLRVEIDFMIPSRL